MFVEVVMWKIILFCLLCFCVLPAYSYDYAKEGFPPLISANSYNNIAEAENSLFGKIYSNEHISFRLNRLEKALFNKTFQKYSYDKRINNVMVNFKNSSCFSGLNKLEQQIFEELYDDDTPENRISRLEQQVFGTIQSGNLLDRYRNLQRVVPSYQANRFNQYGGGLPIVQSGGGWRGLAGAFGNFFNSFGGYPTGYTPPIYSPTVNNYSPDFQRGYYSNRGWGYSNANYGSGSAVHILD